MMFGYLQFFILSVSQKISTQSIATETKRYIISIDAGEAFVTYQGYCLVYVVNVFKSISSFL